MEMIYKNSVPSALTIRHCAKSRKPQVRFPMASLEFGTFHWHNPSDRTMALGSTQPLKEMRGGKGGRCVGLTVLPLHVPIFLKSGNLNLLELSGPVQACIGIAVPFYRIENTVYKLRRGVEVRVNYSRKHDQIFN